MASAANPVLNVARYSALIGGIGYAIVHQRTLQKRHDKHVEHSIKHQVQKNHELKQQRQDQQLLASIKSGAVNGGIESNPDSPSFDLEKYLETLEK